MREWKEYKLKDLSIKITKGTTPSTLGSQFVKGGVNFIKAEAVTKESIIDVSKFYFIDNETHNKLKRSQLEFEDILFSMAGVALGKTALVKESHLPANINQALALIRLDKSLAVPSFVRYFLSQKKVVDYVNSSTSQSAQPNINLAEIGDLKIKIPDKNVQYTISEILSSLDDKIELNNKINQELESLAQLLFKRWFVDFEFPNENGEPYKFSGGEMEDSELGEIPKGWGVLKFKEIVEKYIDNRGKTPPFLEFGIPLVEVKHMSDNEMFPTLKTDKYLSQEVYDTFLRGYLEQKDILMSTVGTIGRLNLVRGDEIFAIAQNVLGVRFNKKFVTQYFMYFLMKSKQFNEEIKSRLIETVQSSIKRSDIEKIPIQLPNYYLVERFDEQVDSIVSQIAVLSKENQKLKVLRDTLLPKLISGELQINEN